MQVVSTGLAIVLLWGFVIWGLVKPRYMNAQVNEWKSWISYNFTWFYIGAFVSQPSPVSNTILLPPSREPEFGNFGEFGETSLFGECDASRRRVCARLDWDAPPSCLVCPSRPRLFVSRVFDGHVSTDPIQTNTADVIFNPRFPAVSHPKSPFRRAG